MIKENVDLLSSNAAKKQGVDLNPDLNKPVGGTTAAAKGKNHIAVG